LLGNPEPMCTYPGHLIGPLMVNIIPTWSKNDGRYLNSLFYRDGDLRRFHFYRTYRPRISALLR